MPIYLLLSLSLSLSLSTLPCGCIQFVYSQDSSTLRLLVVRDTCARFFIGFSSDGILEVDTSIQIRRASTWSVVTHKTRTLTTSVSNEDAPGTAVLWHPKIARVLSSKKNHLVRVKLLWIFRYTRTFKTRFK